MASPCIVTYKGKDYTYEEFASTLHDGLLDNLIKSGAIDASDFKQEASYQKESSEKPKRKYKQIEELTQSELTQKTIRSFENYRQDVLGRNLEAIRKQLLDIAEALKSDKYNDDEKEALISYRDNVIKKQERRDKSKWMAYKEDLKELAKAMKGGKIEDFSIEELAQLYNLTSSFQDASKDAKVKLIQEQLGYKMFLKRKEELKKNPRFVEELADKKDLSWKDIGMKVLSHMPEYVPDLQVLDTMFEDAIFKKIDESYELKTDLEKLGKEVIKEKNKSLGIADKLGSFTFSNSAKYFDFVEHPDGRYYTVEEAKAKGFTDAQMKFLKFMLNLNELRKKQLAEMGIFNLNDEILKVDKKAGEAFQSDGFISALSTYLGNGFNLHNVRINYNGKPTSYGQIEKELIAEGNRGGIGAKGAAIAKLIKYNREARRQLKTKTNIDEKDNPLTTVEGSEYQLSTDGRLKSKFNRNRDKTRGYSKDFYHAAFEFIDDYTHVKHMNPLLPYINSVEYLNKNGIFKDDQVLHAIKPNVAAWVDEWRRAKIFKQPNTVGAGKDIGLALKTLRKLSSLSTMFFNIPANAWNVAMGGYNNFRKETGGTVAKGSARLAKDWMRGGKNVDILKKYQVISIDKDSNPKLFAGSILNQMGYIFNKLGETYNQGSLFLGLMTQDEIDSLEYKTDEYGVKKLVYNPKILGISEKEFTKRMASYKNRVSDIHGKYSEKDLRNYMNNEWGKAIGQYKTWMPDWAKERFGDRYIDSNGVEHIGSYRVMWGQGMKDLQAQIKKEGFVNFMKSDSIEAKAFRSNLKGALTIAVLASIKLGAGDSDEDKKKSEVIDKAIGQIFGILDPHSASFTVSNPVPAVGVLASSIKVIDNVVKGEFKKAGKEAAKITPYNKVVKQVNTVVDTEE